MFVAASVAAIVFFPEWEAIPIHLIWLSLTLLYWLRRWPSRPTAGVLAAIFALTGSLQLWTASRLGDGFSEPTEAPLLAFMFGAIVWYTHRRTLAVDEATRLAQAQRTFLSHASHELRTPITVARGHAQLIRFGDVGRQTAEDADVIIEELKCLSTISDRLLVLARSKHPGFLLKGPVDLGFLLAHAVARWRAEAQRDWSVNIDLPTMLVADEDLLTNAVEALLENAVKFTDEDDPISVRARIEGDVAAIEIEDSGIGIAPDNLPRIFDSFFSAGARARRNGGTGLGLAIVKAIIDAHDGMISVVSEPGVGTIFRICLPRIVPATAVSYGAAPRTAALASPAGGHAVSDVLELLVPHRERQTFSGLSTVGSSTQTWKLPSRQGRFFPVKPAVSLDREGDHHSLLVVTRQVAEQQVRAGLEVNRQLRLSSGLDVLDFVDFLAALRLDVGLPGLHGEVVRGDVGLDDLELVDHLSFVLDREGDLTRRRGVIVEGDLVLVGVPERRADGRSRGAFVR